VSATTSPSFVANTLPTPDARTANSVAVVAGVVLMLLPLPCGSS
jgi:hypothetical protein